ncbi:bifunctional ATP-dependent RNA helicase CHL1-DDX11/Helicase superfamily 1-2 [Babesia duncani]|uniref:Bifunctional ATP-dependent RNA helicase CHL1-DDX11/Helicase superfamily 1-2 n=1 Tax=Babesia duncani TaxID=323732 RepID=A0AAD9PJY1_9APIC|nr:bifunctional ATP-dependent RNA helicase CHL1-DDX11/Helicase superfamily 1-2 [Babesia duncani]
MQNYKNETEKLMLDDLNLPFKLYPAQLKFIKDAYTCFDESRLGLFEAPTGSGKTIAILCSALKWLANNRVNEAMCSLKSSESDDESIPDWVKESANLRIRTEAEFLVKSQDDYLECLRQKYKEFYDVTPNGTKIKETIKRKLTNGQGGNCKLQPSNIESKQEIPSQHPNKVQIIICSRTFTQLNQYVSEFRKLGVLSKNVKLAIAAGKFQVCVNSLVRQKCKSSEELTDECHSIKCNYRTDVLDLKEASMCFPMDIEELVSTGSVLCSCPFYATLESIKYADIILAPYISVLNESLKKTLGIETDGNILIFDEAHNLGDVITASTSSMVLSNQMRALVEQINSYISKYKEILKEEKISLLEIAKVARILAEYKEEIKEPRVTTVSSFLVNLELDQIQFHEMIDFLSTNYYCRKICAWARRLANVNIKQQMHAPNVNAIYIFKEFISTILFTTPSDSVIISHNSGNYTFEIYSVAGDESFYKMGKLKYFQYTPDDSGNNITFDYQTRERESHLQFLCNCIETSCTIVPNGIVVFFSSYAFLESFRKYFKSSGAHVRVLTKKRIFYEAQGQNKMYIRNVVGKGSETFELYSKEATAGGAILFAIFGGALCEGVNFSDKLARLLLLVGQPYPPDSIKLQLKRQHLQVRASEKGISDEQKRALEVLATQQRTILCYKMINQTVGRAMRHKHDYAAVLLIDARYQNNTSLLSSTIQKSLKQRKQEGNMSMIKEHLIQFYKHVTTSTL